MSSVVGHNESYIVALLKGSENYRNWKFSMQMALSAKDLWGVVDGSESKPDDEKKVAAWTKKAQQVFAYIALAMTP